MHAGMCVCCRCHHAALFTCSAQAHLATPTFLLVTAGLMGMQHSQDAMQAAAQQTRAAFAHLNERLATTGGWGAARPAGRRRIGCRRCCCSCLDLKSCIPKRPHLPAGSWLAGGRFSIADIAFVSSVVFDSRLLGAWGSRAGSSGRPSTPTGPLGRIRSAGCDWLARHHLLPLPLLPCCCRRRPSFGVPQPGGLAGPGARAPRRAVRAARAAASSHDRLMCSACRAACRCPAELADLLLPPSPRSKGLNLPDPNPFVQAGSEAGGGGSPRVLEAARGRLANLGLHLGSA